MPESQIDRKLSLPGAHVHMVGIGGVGMSGLAMLLKTAGFRVSGCDLREGKRARRLKEEGIEFQRTHDPEHITDETDWVVRSAAVPSDSAEIARALEKNIPVFRRGEVLARMVSSAPGSIAVAGTHGKTTTTAFVVQVLLAASREISWFAGGDIPGLGICGTGDGALIVVEADESDGTLARYEPEVSVITGAEFDHAENFPDEAAFRDCFVSFILNTRRRLIYCREDPAVRGLIEDLCATGNKLAKNACSYGFDEDSSVRASNIIVDRDAQTFDVHIDGKPLGTISIPAPGPHNVLNSLAACAVALDAGVSFDDLARALKSVKMPARRFERVVDSRRLKVISDYAHHPTEIGALISSARTLDCSRLRAVFQPHRYSRTTALKENFPPAFEGVDELILTPVYAASEKPVRGGAEWDLYAEFRKSGKPASLRLAGSLDEAWLYLRSSVSDGDGVLIIGAGDVDSIALSALADGFDNLELERLRQELAERSVQSNVQVGKPIGEMTGYRVGGTSDLWVEASGVEELSSVLRAANAMGLSFRIFGAGSNILVSDLGVRGVTISPSGRDFNSIENVTDLEVRVGAGVRIGTLLKWLEDRGLSDLEFLNGIPGTVGGALKMNAGAFGGETGRHVKLIRCLNKDGLECIVEGEECGWGYRRCEALKDKVAVEAVFRVSRGDARAISAKKCGFSRRRAWMQGLRCAGSVFRNPVAGPDGPGPVYAGKLIEDAGMKGLSVGGARVSDEHANVIVTGENATASDVRALMGIVRFAVKDRFGVELEPEVDIWS